MADSWKSMAIFVDDKGNGPLKDDKREVTGIKILDDLKQRIEKVEKILNKAKEKMVLKKGKEKMVMERGKTSYEQIAYVLGFVWLISSHSLTYPVTNQSSLKARSTVAERRIVIGGYDVGIKEREEMEGQDEEKKDREEGVSIGVGWLLRLQGFLELLVSSRVRLGL
ncbi:hypothetical protein Tco_0551951 [Tanacetum coccineum]